jgi:hypothetical protein
MTTNSVGGYRPSLPTHSLCSGMVRYGLDPASVSMLCNILLEAWPTEFEHRRSPGLLPLDGQAIPPCGTD